jgi:hypothetical protein
MEPIAVNGRATGDWACAIISCFQQRVPIMIGVATNFGPNVLVLHNVLQPALFVVEFVSIAENVATLWSLKLL